MKKISLVLLAGAMSILGHAQKTNDYGRNILRLYPLNVFSSGNVGVGLSYERILSSDGKFGLKIPIHWGVDEANDGYYSDDVITRSGFMVNPSVKFYPAGQRKVTYGLGFSLFGVWANNDYYKYDNGFVRRVDGTREQMGMLLENSVQFNLSPKFNIGLELGIGPSYINRYTENGRTYNDGITAMGLFNFHVGYRF